MMRSGDQGSSRPGLSTTGALSAMAGIQSECTPGELDGSTAPKMRPSRKVGERAAFIVAKTLVENGQVEAARETGDDCLDLIEDAEDLARIVAAERDGHARGGREVVDVVVE